MKASKDPSTFTVLFEDSAALLGLLVALVGIYLSYALDTPYLDGAASVVIGLILGAVAVLLAHESRGLLLGESASPRVVAGIRALGAADRAVERVVSALTMHLGPQEILLNMDIRFRTGLSPGEIEAAVERLESAIRKQYPAVKRIFIEAKSLAGARTREAATSEESLGEGRYPP